MFSSIFYVYDARKLQYCMICMTKGGWTPVHRFSCSDRPPRKQAWQSVLFHHVAIGSTGRQLVLRLGLG